MIDIETASTEYNAVIVSIGAVCFSVSLPELKPVTYEILIDKEDGDSLGLHTSEDTMKWWKTQPEEVYRHAFVEGPRVSTKDALIGLSSFIETYPTIKQYWCQGINFDPVVLETAYKKCGLTPKWKFYQLRDSRTIQYLLPKLPFSKPKDAHTPVADCLYQIKMVHYVYSQLNIYTTSHSPKLKDSSTWVCGGCHTSNYSSRSVCYKCFKDKQGVQQPKQEDWICEDCELSNFSYRKSCFKCKRKREENEN